MHWCTVYVVNKFKLYTMIPAKEYLLLRLHLPVLAPRLLGYSPSLLARASTTGMMFKKETQNFTVFVHSH